MSTQNNIQSSILDKVSKLLAKADSSRHIGSIQEAEAFAEKAMELMIRHNMSIDDIETHSNTKNQVVTETGLDNGIQYGSIKSDGDFELKLANVIASYNMCRIIYNKYSKRISIVGRADNIPTVSFIFTTVRDIIRRASRETYIALVNIEKGKMAVKANSKDEAVMLMADKVLIGMMTGEIHGLKRNIKVSDIVEIDGLKGTYTIGRPEVIGLAPYREVYIRNFLKGAVDGVHSKLIRAKYEAEQKENKFGIVLAKRDKENEEYMEANNVKFVNDRKVKIHDAEAYENGRQIGKNVNINRGLESKTEYKKLS